MHASTALRPPRRTVSTTTTTRTTNTKPTNTKPTNSDDIVIPCRDNDAELWFSERPAEIAVAKTLCQECPVRALCLEGALERKEPWGVWGGEIIVNGSVVANKRGRGRPRKSEGAAAA